MNDSGISRSVGRLLLALLVALPFELSACTNNGEGERCVPLNGNSDCESPFECVKLQADETVGFCCLPNGASAVGGCSQTETPISNDGGANEATSDTSAGTGIDASTPDVSADAGDTGAADRSLDGTNDASAFSDTLMSLDVPDGSDGSGTSILTDSALNGDGDGH